MTAVLIGIATLIGRTFLKKIAPHLVIWGAGILGQQLLIKYIHQHILHDYHG